MRGESGFKDLRPDLAIGLGGVDVTPGNIDSAETIAACTRQALKFLAPERSTLNPDCGCAPGSGAVVSLTKRTGSWPTKRRPRSGRREASG